MGGVGQFRAADAVGRWSRRRRITLAQRPRTDLQLLHPEEVHRPLGDQRPGQQLRGPPLGDPGQTPALVGGHRRQLRHPLLQRLAGQGALYVQAVRGARGARDPGELLERLGGRHDMVRTAEAAEFADRTGDLGPYMAAQRLHLRRVRRIARQPAGGEASGSERQRHRGVGLLVDAETDLQRAATDVQDQQPPGRPAEPAAGGEEGEPCLLLAGEDSEVDAGLFPYPGQHLVGVARFPYRGRGERQHVLAALVLGGLQRIGDRHDKPVHAGGSDRPVRVQQFGQAQLRLVRMRGQRAGAGVRVHHQQMNRVRPHVEDSESHTRHATAPADLLLARAKDEKGEAGQSHQEAENEAGDAAAGSERAGPVRRREGDRLRTCLGRVPRPRGRRTDLPLRPDLAHLQVDLHLRQWLSGHPGGPCGRRVLHAGRALLGRGRREAGGGPCLPADPGAVAVP